MIAVLSGGVGAARLLAGLQLVVAPERLAAVVNVADDTVLHGLLICPDLDTITYTLAGAIDPERGWGLVGESWRVMSTLERFGAVRPPGSGAGGTWFSLGDQDIATHLYRTHRLSEGATLSEVAAEIAQAYGVGVRVLPVSDDTIRTRLTVAGTADRGATGEGAAEGDAELGFQEYFVGRHHDVPISAVRFAGAEEARLTRAAAQVLDEADLLVIAPSNPIVSIGPLLAVDGVRSCLERRRDVSVAVSPIVGGRALKGPADRMLRELGHPVSVVGVARLYRDIAATLVIDGADEALAGEAEAEGIRCIVTDTVMGSPEVSAALATTVLGVGGISA
jgi:LPPG:FO 2-phospho-L-lactate transferase